MGMDQDRGLVTQRISKKLRDWCDAAHTAFLASHNLDYWHFTVVGVNLIRFLNTNDTAAIFWRTAISSVRRELSASGR